MKELARQCFGSLNYDKHDGMYYVLMDGNFHDKFYVYDEDLEVQHEKAIERFYEVYCK